MFPEALKHGAKVITGARVREITVNGNGLATGAVYIDRQGREQFQAADVVVVACNGVGTARLLLLSESSRFPDGLANSSGLVGKRLMLHPYMSVLGIYEDELEGWLGPWGTQLLSLQFADHDESRGFPRGAQWDVMPLGGPLFSLFRYDDRPFDERWGPAVHDLIERTLGHAFDWGVGIEDLPHERNMVTIDPELRDSDGIPAPKVHFEIDADMRANLRVAARSRARGPRGGRRDRHHRLGLVGLGLAPPRHGPHGRRPGDVRRRPLGRGTRRAEPLCHGRQRLRDLRPDGADRDDLRQRAALHRAADRAGERPASTCVVRSGGGPATGTSHPQPQAAYPATCTGRSDRPLRTEHADERTTGHHPSGLRPHDPPASGPSGPVPDRPGAAVPLGSRITRPATRGPTPNPRGPVEGRSPPDRTCR